jgi:hypothetical protein
MLSVSLCPKSDHIKRLPLYFLSYSSCFFICFVLHLNKQKLIFLNFVFQGRIVVRDARHGRRERGQPVDQQERLEGRRHRIRYHL